MGNLKRTFPCLSIYMCQGTDCRSRSPRSLSPTLEQAGTSNYWVRNIFLSYWVELRAKANFSAPTFEPAHEAHAGQHAALSVHWQLQLRCSTTINGPYASSLRSELSAKREVENVISFCQADRNLSSKSLANYFQSKKRQPKVVRR